MYSDGKIIVGSSDGEPISIYPSKICRHGLIAGATGTGKTTTLKVLAESFSDAGIPVFLADVKGDLASLAFPGEPSEKIDARAEKLGLTELGFHYHKFPVNFWDVFGKGGMPLRTTVSELGPLLLARVLNLNETQSAILTILFRIADEEDLLLIDTKDLKALLQFVSENRAEYSLEYGNMSSQSLASILRAVIALETEGADKFIGEPAVNIQDFLDWNEEGQGILQVLDCRELFLQPRMYSMFLLWLMSELFESLPEVGDVEKPRMVFFFDEAHLLFDDAPKSLTEKIEQVVKLIRSKGVGIYFVTQSPSDLPDEVLAQLGNKIQHALRAYTPQEQKKLRAAAMSFRANPEFDTMQALQELGTGEAIVSVLDEEGVPTIVKKTKIAPPESRMGVVTEEERQAEIAANPLAEKYRDMIDRDSAYEFIMRHLSLIREEQEKAEQQALEEKQATQQAKLDDSQKAREERARQRAEELRNKKAQAAAKRVAKSTSGSLGRAIGKTIGGALGGKYGRKIGGTLGSELGRGIIGTFFDK